MGSEELRALIRGHLDLHPGFGPEDLAKLLYQGVMGMDHLLGDRDAFLTQLSQEWEALGPPLPGEVPLEPVHPTDPVFRVNLRPLKAAGVRVEEVGSLLADQPRRQGDLEELLSLWADALALAWAGEIPFTPEDLRALGERMGAGSPPGHSLRYRERNRPAYRLVHDATSPRFAPLLRIAGWA